MKIKTILQNSAGAAALALCMFACQKAQTGAPKATKEKEEILSAYPEVPRDEIVQNEAVWTEMKNRYKQYVVSLNDKITATGATFVILYITPEIGNSATPAQKAGKPFLESLCRETGVRFVDLTTNLTDKDPKALTHMPIDGHWSKLGSQLIAAGLAPVIESVGDHRTTVTYTERPALFGDQKAGQDEVLDGGKNLPYRLQTNSQGLRMQYDLAFPKTKQRILFLGDSGFFFPFLDNKDIATNLVQEKYPNKEMINACNWGYSIDDYVTLFDERAKYTEPDVVMLQTSGNDILDMFFSNRNRFSRNPQAYTPSAAEIAYYDKTYKSK